MASDKVVIDIVAKDDTKKGIKKAEKSFKGLSATVTKLAAAGFGIVAIKNFGEAMLDANIEVQKLNASLVSVTGSQGKANDAFAWLKDFAKETPFQLNQVVDSFIKMKALGLDPTEDSLRSFGNTASAMGKDLNQMIEAVADASTGEFERLKEFGIKARSEGDKVSFTFQNVTTTVGKNAKEITAFLKTIGEEKFGDAMSEQMKTLGGSISNLEDSWNTFLVTLGESGPADLAAESILALSESLTTLSTSMELFKEFQKGGVGFWDWLTANPEEAKELIANAKFVDVELQGLVESVNDLRTAKSGNFWWTAREEADLQQALKNLEDYRIELLATGGTDAPSGRGGDSSPSDSARQQAIDALAIQREAGIAASIAQQEIDDRRSEQLRMLMAANKEQYELDVKAKEEAEDKKAKAEQNARDAGMQALSDLGSLMNSENKKAFEIGKAARISETLINTYSSATKAFGSLAEIPIVGPALGAAAAGAAIAAGLANVQAISSTQFGGKGGGTPSVPSFSSSGGVASTQPVGQPQNAASIAQQVGDNIEVRTGSIIGVLMEEEIIPALIEAQTRGVKVIIN